jgi:quercetin dioxygenase-like cupin family protein
MPTSPPEEIRFGGLAIRYLIDGTTTSSPLSLFEFTVAPGSRVPVAHSHDAYEETCYALEGTLTLTLWSPSGEPQRHETAPGDSLVIPRGIVHRFDNFSTAPTRTLAIITPGILGAAYFRQIAAVLAAAAPGTPPDPAAIGAVMRRHGLTPAPGR